jgi:hypothetical protein
VRRSYAWQVLATVVLFTVVEVGLRVRTLPVLADRLGVRLSSATRPATPPTSLPRWALGPVRSAAAVGRRWPVGPEGSCLREALVLARRLRALDPEVVLGVRKVDGGAVQAHAWVVVRGGSLDPTAGTFVQLPVAER